MTLRSASLPIRNVAIKWHWFYFPSLISVNFLINSHWIFFLTGNFFLFYCIIFYSHCPLYEVTMKRFLPSFKLYQILKLAKLFKVQIFSCHHHPLPCPFKYFSASQHWNTLHVISTGRWLKSITCLQTLNVLASAYLSCFILKHNHPHPIFSLHSLSFSSITTLLLLKGFLMCSFAWKA